MVVEKVNTYTESLNVSAKITKVVKIVLHTYAVSNGHVEYKEYTLFGKTTLPGCQMCKLARKKYFKVITNQKPTLCPCQ